MRFSSRLRVLENRALGSDLFVLSVDAGDMARTAKPGQFVNLSSERDDPLLPRPFSVFNVRGHVADFLIKKRGKATQLLSELGPGEEILATGPLGKPLPGLESPILVAGGVGVAPLAFYQRREGGTLLLGLREPVPGLEDLLRDTGAEIIHENDPAGGTVVDLLRRGHAKEGAYIACGPTPMLRALLDAIPEERAILVLEGMMACGVGLCLGCAVRARAGGYLRTCTQGPWFQARDLDLKEALGPKDGRKRA